MNVYLTINSCVVFISNSLVFVLDYSAGKEERQTAAPEKTDAAVPQFYYAINPFG